MKRGLEEEMGMREKGTSRCTWSEAEDKALREMAESHKGEYWNLVAKCVGRFSAPGTKAKTAKQCRERWHNQLKPNVQLGSLSDQEENKVFALHSKFGNRWSKIAARLPGRTDNVIKNYFLCKLRKIVRGIKKECGKPAGPRSESDLERTFYLLDYLYKYYVSPERDENIRKALNSQIKKRKNRGDKYINKMVLSEGISAEKLRTFARSLHAASPSLLATPKFRDYIYLFDLAPTRNEQRLSSVDSSAHHEDQRSGTVGSVSSVENSVRTLPEAWTPCFPLLLPLPHRPSLKSKNVADDFKPTFFFSGYSFPNVCPLICTLSCHQQLVGENTAVGKCDAALQAKKKFK